MSIAVTRQPASTPARTAKKRGRPSVESSLSVQNTPKERGKRLAESLVDALQATKPKSGRRKKKKKKSGFELAKEFLDGLEEGERPVYWMMLVSPNFAADKIEDLRKKAGEPSEAECWIAEDRDQDERTKFNLSSTSLIESKHIRREFGYIGGLQLRCGQIHALLLGMSPSKAVDASLRVPRTHLAVIVSQSPEKVDLLARSQLDWHDSSSDRRRASPTPPPKYEASHLCHKPGCFNPFHLTIETAGLNAARRRCTERRTPCECEPACILFDKAAENVATRLLPRLSPSTNPTPSSSSSSPATSSSSPPQSSPPSPRPRTIIDLSSDTDSEPNYSSSPSLRSSRPHAAHTLPTPPPTPLVRQRSTILVLSDDLDDDQPLTPSRASGRRKGKGRGKKTKDPAPKRAAEEREDSPEIVIVSRGRAVWDKGKGLHQRKGREEGGKQGEVEVEVPAAGAERVEREGEGEKGEVGGVVEERKARLGWLRSLVAAVQIKEVADDDWSDSSSVASDAIELDDAEDQQLSLYDPSQETLAERLAALKDMVSPSTRASIAQSIGQVKGYTKWTVGKVGTAAWVTCTSALLVGLPLLLSIEGEAAIVQQEKEFLAQPGAAAAYGAPPASGAPAGGAPQGVVPSGF
ncbi:hypothetical protein JCM8547_005369 [Rhodosporidiobolus lusitaniae]